VPSGMRPCGVVSGYVLPRKRACVAAFFPARTGKAHVAREAGRKPYLYSGNSSSLKVATGNSSSRLRPGR
jgi:hypothetical protein